MKHFITDKERLFLYLNGQLSNSSFRKWLLTSPSVSEIFGSDSKTLKELADKFSMKGKIHEILIKHIDTNEFNRYKAKQYLDKNCHSGQDPLDLIRHLSSIASLLSNKSLIDKISALISLTNNMPALREETLWNHDSFAKKRSALPDLTTEIIETYKEVIDNVSVGTM